MPTDQEHIDTTPARTDGPGEPEGSTQTTTGRLARFIASRDGHVAPLADAQRQAIADLTGGGRPLPDEEPPPKRVHPPEQGRLGDRCPQFRKLSEGVAEANRRSSGGYP